MRRSIPASDLDRRQHVIGGHHECIRERAPQHLQRERIELRIGLRDERRVLDLHAVLAGRDGEVVAAIGADGGAVDEEMMRAHLVALDERNPSVRRGAIDGRTAAHVEASGRGRAGVEQRARIRRVHAVGR